MKLIFNIDLDRERIIKEYLEFCEDITTPNIKDFIEYLAVNLFSSYSIHINNIELDDITDDKFNKFLNSRLNETSI